MHISLKKIVSFCIIASIQLSLSACSAENQTKMPDTQPDVIKSSADQYQIQAFADFNEPWAMDEMPDGRLLVTEKSGQLKIFDPKTAKIMQVQELPKVAYGGQGGLGDVHLHPNFADNSWIYLSYAEQDQDLYGAVVVRAQLHLDQNRAYLSQIQRIWEQVPKLKGQGHYAHRIVVDRDKKLWISSGERQAFTPAQDINSNLGKIIRLNEDGSVPQDNPFKQQGSIAAQIWSLGHRNPLGMTFDTQGQLWVIEMGPKGGDELNLIQKGQNYGYPIVSNGDHYDGQSIPDHATRPDFKAPALDWSPVISPSSLIFYNGSQFPEWQGKAITTGLSSKALIIIDTESKPVKEIQRIDMQHRMRAVLASKDGGLWLLQDGPNAKLLKMTRH